MNEEERKAYEQVLTDILAGLAMQAIISKAGYGAFLAAAAYDIAEAMLAEKRKRNPTGV